MSYTPENIDKIVKIGKKARPNEACGIIVRGELHELTNRALERTENSVMFTADMLEILGNYEDIEPQEITVWHTHPSGQGMPSAVDLQNKPTDGPGAKMLYLVVAIPSGQATLY